MNYQFKAGDLALVICGPNTGACVELVAFLRPGEQVGGFHEYKGGPFMRNECGADGWLVMFSDLDIALERPSDLMPLRGDFAPDLQKAREVSA